MGSIPVKLVPAIDMAGPVRLSALQGPRILANERLHGFETGEDVLDVALDAIEESGLY
jgi:hypothetical protein